MKAARWTVAVIIAAHGLIHLLGAVKGLGWADVSALHQSVSSSLGLAWLATGALVLAAGVMLAVARRGWWIVGAVAVVASQGMISTAWGDARPGTAAKVVLLIGVVYGYASEGPTSYRSEFRRRSDAALAQPILSPVVTATDLGLLPDPVAAYVRQSGAIGQPAVADFHAHISGRIRSAQKARWMPFHGEQVNTYGEDPARLFFIEARMLGLPLDVLHVFVGASATMRVKAASLVRFVDAAGPEMDRGETVTIFNDLCVLAPSALVHAAVAWEPIDAHHVRGAFTRGGRTVTAVLVFNDAHELIDFVSDDRAAASADGKRFVSQRWSTPLGGYRFFGTVRVAATGEGRWHAPEPDGEFTYIELHVDDITYNTGGGAARERLAAVGREVPAAA